MIEILLVTPPARPGSWTGTTKGGCMDCAERGTWRLSVWSAWKFHEYRGKRRAGDDRKLWWQAHLATLHKELQ